MSETELYRPKIAGVNAVLGAVIASKQTNAVHITSWIVATGVSGFQTTESNRLPGTPPTGAEFAGSVIVLCRLLPADGPNLPAQ